MGVVSPLARRLPCLFGSIAPPVLLPFPCTLGQPNFPRAVGSEAGCISFVGAGGRSMGTAARLGLAGEGMISFLGKPRQGRTKDTTGRGDYGRQVRGVLSL